MAVGVSGCYALTEGLEAPHLCLDPASDVVSGPAFPECPAIVPGGAQGFVSRDRGRAVLFPRTPVLTDRDDRSGLPVDDGGVAAAGVIGTVRRHCADLLAFGDLVQQLWQNGAVTVAAGRKLHGADVGRGGIHGQMDLAPLAAALHAVLARLPFAITEELYPGTVHQQVQGAIGAPIRDLDSQSFLPPTQGRIVGHGPVQVCQLQQAGHHPGRLPERQLEQHLDRQTELDRGIREDRRATGAAIMRREPGHVLVQPDQQRTAPAKRGSVTGPVCRAVAGGGWLAHATRLTAWIHVVNPRQSVLCNNAVLNRKP